MSIVKFESLENKFLTVNKQFVLLDSDIAKLYGVEVKRVNENVNKNLDKFPDETYMIQLSLEQWQSLKSEKTTSKGRGGKHKPPRVFTEKGLYMIATILKSSIATQATLHIIETFAKLRELNRNINTIITLENEPEQKQLIQKSNEILEDVMDIVFEEKDEDNNIIESETKIELNLGFYKKTKTTKRKKE